MLRPAAAFVALICLPLAATAAAQPPADSGLAQKIHEFYQKYGGTTNPLQQWGLEIESSGPLAAEEAQRLREIVDAFHREAAEARSAADFADVRVLVPVRETVTLPGTPQRTITLHGRLLEREVTQLSALVDRLQAEMPEVAPALLTEPPAPDLATMKQLMAQVSEFQAEVSQRIIDVSLRKPAEEEAFHLCSICDITLTGCLADSSRILDDCVSSIGDFRFCSNLYFQLNRFCHYEHINCVVAFCS